MVASIGSVGVPGSSRMSMSAEAREGTTFTALPAERRVMAIESRRSDR
jgi:hypothetical protein